MPVPGPGNSDKVLAGLRSELKRFAAEELRSELNMAVERMHQVVKQEVTEAFQGKPLARGLSPVAMQKKASSFNSLPSEALRSSSSASLGDQASKNWVSRLRTTLKVPLGDGIDELPADETRNLQRLTYTALPGPLLHEDTDQTKTSCDTESSGATTDILLRRRATRKSRSSVRKSLTRQAVRPRASLLGADTYSARWLPSLAQQVVDRVYFDYIVCSVIAANALLLGFEADWEVQNLSIHHPTLYRLLDMGFCLFFTFEISLRMVAYGAWFFSCNTPEWTWNYFDFSIVCLQIAEVILSFVGGGLHPSLRIFKVFRMIRLCRCARIFRLVRVFRLVPELHMLVVTCAGSMRSLFWTMMLLLFTTYVFGMYLIQVVAEHGLAHPDDLQTGKDLQVYFGSICKATFKLYQTMFNGEQWSNLTQPLMDNISPWLGVIFATYIAFTVICLLNVITGVFLTSAMQTADDDRNRRMIEEIRRFFKEADEDHSGHINIDDFEQHLDDPQMQMYLRTIDLIPDEAAELFLLLDKENSGQVSLSEFTHGCMRLRGHAKAIDFAVFVSEYEKTCERQFTQMAKVEDSLNEIIGALRKHYSWP